MKTRGPEQELTKDFIVQKNNNDNSLSGFAESLSFTNCDVFLYTQTEQLLLEVSASIQS